MRGEKKHQFRFNYVYSDQNKRLKLLGTAAGWSTLVSPDDSGEIASSGMDKWRNTIYVADNEEYEYGHFSDSNSNSQDSQESNWDMH